MILKTLDFGPECAFTGDSTTLYVDPRDTRLAKYASRCEEALAYLKSAPAPPENMLRVLVLAMTSWEYYGPNRNGDGFHARPFTLNGKILSVYDETLPVHHKSFERVGKNFMHHVNKDPNKAVGHVERSFWNAHMHRVELVVLVDKLKAPTIAQRILDGDFPAVSMGCKIPYDICIVCGNKAPTRNEYCIHCNGMDPRYGLNVILEDGTQICVLNPCPYLFDISWVIKPADRQGFMLQAASTLSKTASVYALQHGLYVPQHLTGQDKIASLDAAYSMESVAKSAALRKVSELDKYVSGDIADLQAVNDADDCGCWDPPTMNQQHAAVRGMQPLLAGIRATVTPLSDDAVRQLAQFDRSDVLSTCMDHDMVPTPQELFRMECARSKIPSNRLLESLMPALERALVLGMQYTPDDLDQYQVELGLDTRPPSHSVATKISAIIAPYVEKRALNNEHIARRLLPEPIAAHVLPMMGVDPVEAYRRPQEEVLEVVGDDGQVHRTTRREAESTDWGNKRKKLFENAAIAAGTGATMSTLGLLAVAHKGLRLPAAVGMLPAAAIGTSMLYGNRKGTPEVMSTTGEGIPVNTPFASKQAQHLGRLQPYQLVALMCVEKQAGSLRLPISDAQALSVWRSVRFSGQPGDSLIQKTARAIDQWARSLPH